MSDFARHVDDATCACTTCLIVNHCGVHADDPMWAEIALAGDTRVALYLLTGQPPPIWPQPGPFCGERPWFALWGLGLDSTQVTDETG